MENLMQSLDFIQNSLIFSGLGLGTFLVLLPIIFFLNNRKNFRICSRIVLFSKVLFLTLSILIGIVLLFLTIQSIS